MKNKKYLSLVALCIGVTTVLINITMDVWLPTISESFGTYRWVFVGIGAGLTGAAASTLLSKKMYKTNPELARQARINENDERYVQVRKTAAYYMWFITLFVLVAISLTFVALNLKIAAWLGLGTLSLHIVLYVILLFKLNKTM
ncbi:hypothetical protein GCM10011351_13710 [Paraliobacillus quinghaiensis]|uniref:DUF2178 domain-containing protein n=1 Tax=Paraliobacillus quinghaiensis TaxID=470815 RepID=A0A917TMV0_9BACI|nr:hypothetical protein [Paraliobacillus quinghaiensis]GGM28953.1 hypothetical protein GCM10011351_13710 [Paraliobacillus quinghaiensis]